MLMAVFPSCHPRVGKLEESVKKRQTRGRRFQAKGGRHSLGEYKSQEKMLLTRSGWHSALQLVTGTTK